MTSSGQPLPFNSPAGLWEDPAIVGKFHVESVIGTGGMGVVVAARHLELDELVAIKFLLPDAARSPAAQARFRREARTAAKIKNEHVARVIDVSTTESGIPFIVMEYLDGRDLERVLRETTGNRLFLSDAVDLVLQAAEALAAGHRLGIVHRDLKPANLFCVERGLALPEVKVLDYGISKLADPRSDLERTDRNEILGSPRYMSPEQIDSSSTVDLRSDIWSIGVILYESLTGQVPFGGQALPELWYRIRTESPAPPSSLCAEVPAAIDPAVMKCLEKEPARRYAHLGELALALAPFSSPRARTSLERLIGQSETVTVIATRTSEPSSNGRHSIHGSSSSITVRNRPRSRAGKVWLGGAAASGLAAAGMVVLLSLRPDEERQGPATAPPSPCVSSWNPLDWGPRVPGSLTHLAGEAVVPAGDSPKPSTDPLPAARPDNTVSVPPKKTLSLPLRTATTAATASTVPVASGSSHSASALQPSGSVALRMGYPIGPVHVRKGGTGGALSRGISSSLPVAPAGPPKGVEPTQPVNP